MGSQRPSNGKILAGIVEESLMLDMMVNVYKMMQEGVRQYSNISLELVPISKFDLNEETVFNNAELPLEMDMLLMPFDYSLVANLKNANITRLTRIFRPSYTFLLSPAPKSNTNASLTFIAIEPIVSWLMVVSLFMVSVVMSLAITPRYKATSPIKEFWLRFKSFTQKFKAHLWQNANLLFSEDYPLVPHSLPWRIAFMSWLFGVMLLSFEISSYLKSEFSEIKYTRVDTIDDLLKQAGKIKIGIMEGGVEDVLFTKRALKEDKYQRLQEILNGDPSKGEKMNIVDLITGDIFDSVASQELIFISGSITVLATMTHHFYTTMKESSLFDFKEIYYFSPPIDESYGVGVFSTSFAGTPYSTVINELLTITSECQLAQPVVGRVYFMVDILRWSEPALLENSKLTLKGAESVIMLYLIGNAIAIAYFLLTTIATLIINLYKN